MRRTSKTKAKKSDIISDSEEEVSNSAPVDNNETDEATEVDTSTSSRKKRNARGQMKTNEETPSDNDEDKSDNETSPSKRKKKASDEIPENGKSESDDEADKSVSKRKKNKQSKTNDENDEEIVKEVEQNGKSPGKGKKKGKTPQKKEEKPEEEEEEYEVEKIVDQRTIKGRRQFLVRWKGYSEDSDTWENEKDLNCDRLIEEFLTEQEENEPIEEKKGKIEKKKSKKQDKPAMNQKKNNKTKSKEDKNDDDSSDDGNSTNSTEYEVGRIIDVYFKKDKTRDFLIRWKGFTAKEDTWEPEEHLNCPELINKFMEKVEKSRGTDSRDLRMNPSHTKRYTLTMYADKRQSRRNASKQRVTYFECDN